MPFRLSAADRPPPGRIVTRGEPRRTRCPCCPAGLPAFCFGPPRPAPAEGKGTLAGAGQLAMPVGDLMIWDNVVLHRSAVLKSASWGLMETPFVLPSGKSTGYGMGFTIRQL